MRIAEEVNDVIVNVVEAGSLAEAQALWPAKSLLEAGDKEIGWVKENDVYVKPVVPAPDVVYQTISITKFARLCRGPGGMTDAMLVEAYSNPLLAAVWITLNMSTQIHKLDPELAPGLTAFNALGK